MEREEDAAPASAQDIDDQQIHEFNDIGLALRLAALRAETAG